MTRLSEAPLASLPADVIRPAYDRSAIKAGVVHLGIGAFHRAHQAALFEAALASGDLRWGIIGASLRSSSVFDQMAPQDGLYTLCVRDGAQEQLQIIGAVREVLVAPRDPQALVAAMASADVHIVTLTVTEKGYRLDPVSGELREDDEDVAADLASLSAPRTAPGFIVAALARRHAAGLPPFTAISCDNIPDNGSRLKASVLAIARRHDGPLADWIAQHGAFPATMVDRIVPATSADDIQALGQRMGVEDRAMVKTEPFTQWVIEDHFAGARPDFAALGAQLTASVAPWEEAKLRLLNGAHSAIAYLGGLAGLTFVHEVVALPKARTFVEALWDEAAATLTPPPGLDIPAYRAALMRRFANSALQHRTRQIAMDGSQKLPQRLLSTIAWRLDRGLPIDALATGVAAWMRWQSGIDDMGARFQVDDPLADVTRAAVSRATSADDHVGALLTIDAIFPPTLAASPDFRRIVSAKYRTLSQAGARSVLGA